jgi:hypothetical protein
LKLPSFLAATTVVASLLTAAPALAASPVISGQTNSVTSVYPVVDGYFDTITFAWNLDQALDQPGATLVLDVVDASTHTSVFQVPFDDVTETGYIWNGRGTGGSVVADGTYYARITADNGTDPADSNNGPSFVVSGKKLTQHTFTKQVSAAASMEGKFAGKCSQTRNPGLKLGAGSLGYYSNTKCTTAHQDFAASFHTIAVPTSFRPGTVRLSAYGVAVKAASTMRLGFMGDPSPFRIGSAKGWHNGPLVPAARSIEANRLGWMAIANAGNRYDIKYFKVVYTYTTLS